MSRIKQSCINVCLALLFVFVTMPAPYAQAPQSQLEPSPQALPSWWHQTTGTAPRGYTASVWQPQEGARAPLSFLEQRLSAESHIPTVGVAERLPQARVPRLVITKRDDVDPVPAGGPLRYTITYTNVGNADARNAVVTEFYDARVSYQFAVPEPSMGNNVWILDHRLAPGQSGSIVVEVQVDDSLVAGTTLTNVVQMDDPDAIRAVFTETTVVTSTPELTMALDAQPNPVDARSNLVYHVHYENSGNGPAANAVLTMHYDEELAFSSSVPPPADGTDDKWHLGGLAAGAEGDIYVIAVVGGSIDDLDTLTSSAVLSSDGNVVTTTEQTFVHAPWLALSKTATPDPVQAFSALTYTLTFSNNGHAATSALEVTDALPARTDFLQCWGLPCALSGGVVRWQMSGGLEPESSRAITLVVGVQRNLDSGSLITNLAQVSVIDAPYYAAQSKIETTVLSSPSLWLSISNGQTSVEAAERLTYALRVSNTGNGGARETTVAATPPAPDLAGDIACAPVALCDVQADTVSYAIGLVPGGEERTVYLFATVRDPLPAGARSIVASAVVSTVTPGDALNGNTAEDGDAITTRPDLVIRADYEDTMPWPGKHVTYTLRFSNAGHMAATGVNITATEPSYSAFEGEASSPGWVSRGDGRFTYAVGEMDHAQVDELTFVVLLAGAGFTPETTNFDAAFEILDESGGVEDRFPGDNLFWAPLGVPNLVIDKAMASPSIWSGGQGTLRVTVRNNGTGPACGVYLPDVGCTPFAMDVFVNSDTPPSSYPIAGFGDCYVFVDPILAGLTETVLISFTHDPDLQFQPGFCRAEPVHDMWLKIDNWDPSADPFPGPYGLVPEYNEFDNLHNPPSGGPRLYLPLFLLSH